MEGQHFEQTNEDGSTKATGKEDEGHVNHMDGNLCVVDSLLVIAYGLPRFELGLYTFEYAALPHADDAHINGFQDLHENRKLVWRVKIFDSEPVSPFWVASC